MSKEFVCPNCHIVVDDDRLVVTTQTIEACPHCRFTLRKQEGFRWQDRAAVVAGDVATIREWITEVARDGVNVGLDLGPSQEHQEDQPQGSRRWEWSEARLDGQPLPWLLSVEYDTSLPRCCSLRLTAERVSKAEMPEENLLTSVCAALGVQPHGSIQDSWSAWEGARTRVRWGATQYLSATPKALSPALFVAVVRRLDAAMREASRRLPLSEDVRNGSASLGLDAEPEPIPRRNDAHSP